MAKKQKKHSKQGGSTIITQNSPLYAFSRAMNVKTANQVREINKTSKSNAVSYAKAFRIDKLTAEGTVMFPDANMILDTVEHIKEDNPKIHFAWMIVRAAMANVLSQRRVVTDITPEAMAFIQSNADLFQDDVCFVPETESLIHPGIVCFPDGTGFCYAMTNLPVEPMIQIAIEQNGGNGQIRKDAAGLNAMVVTSFDENGYSGLTIMFLPYKGTTLADISNEDFPLIRIRDTSKADNSTMAADAAQKGSNSTQCVLSDGEREKLTLYVKTLVYLAHIEKLHEKSIEAMGVQHTDVGSPRIHHVTIPGMQPNWTMVPFGMGFNVPKYGLHPYYGFLTPQIMKDALSGYAEVNADGDLAEIDSNGERIFQDHATAEEFGVLKRWINHSTVYSITDSVTSACLSKYKNSDVEWINLLSELPSREFVLSFDNRRMFAIVAIRKMHIYVSYMKKGIEPRHIPYVSLAMSKPSDYEEPFQSILCILIHISSYFKRRREVLEERKQQMDAGRRVGGMSAHIGAKPASAESVSMGYDIDFDQLRLFNVTDHAVKAVSSKARASRYGWHMPTHIRQAHKHRFWVGSGKNRHLEERWVEATIINKDGEPKARIHKVKVETPNRSES